ncbi:MAG: GNAT family N-acetyltransferase [Chloroflexi bacterium]|nr:GNAT family N-acetyltransferase [Chloroflexota bacterium]
MNIRAVELPDVDALADVLGPEVSRAQVRRRYDESLLGYREMLVAELDGRVVGTVSTGGWGFQRPNSLRMFALDVGKEFRSRGVGTALIDAVEAAAISLHMNEVNLEVSVDNVNAIRLYKRLGYRCLQEPVTESWDELDEERNRRTVEGLSWIMIKENGRTEDDAMRTES